MTCCVWSEWQLDCDFDYATQYTNHTESAEMMLLGLYFGMLITVCCCVLNISILCEKQAEIDQLKQERLVNQSSVSSLKKSYSYDGCVSEKQTPDDKKSHSGSDSGDNNGPSSDNDESCLSDGSSVSTGSNKSKKNSSDSEKWEEWTPDWDSEL
jgi:hypothetical protein